MESFISGAIGRRMPPLSFLPHIWSSLISFISLLLLYTSLMTDDEPLREDVRLLGDLLGITIRDQAGEAIFDTIEKIRQLSKAAIMGDTAAAPQLVKILHELSANDLL